MSRVIKVQTEKKVLEGFLTFLHQGISQPLTIGGQEEISLGTSYAITAHCKVP